MIFDTIREQIKKIIKERWFKSSTSSRSNIGYSLGRRIKLSILYIVKTTKKHVFVVCDGDIFKVGVDIKRAKNLGTKHVCPYVKEVKEEVQHWRFGHP